MTIAAITINKYKLTTTNVFGDVITQTMWAMPTALDEYIEEHKLTDAKFELIDYGIQKGEEITEEQIKRMKKKPEVVLRKKEEED
jgi:hypothetical protein